ncbi:hypothetical protein V6N13_041119 [Hibiscus sabdariffa]
MAVAENSGAKIGSSGRNVENAERGNFEEGKPAAAVVSNGNGGNGTDLKDGFDEENGGNGGILKNGMSDLAEMLLSKLNPMAEEFIPPSLANHQNLKDDGSAESVKKRNKKYGLAKRKLNMKTSIAQRADAIRNTVYVTDIDQQVTEEVLAGLFLSCGPIVDCRICGVPISAVRFAFIEFHNEEAAKAALNLSGTILGFYPLKVLPSKTAIAPVNPTYLPKSEDEREMCLRTIYCTNIDKKVTQAGIKAFFESICGQVRRSKLLKDSHHPTHSAFVEFTTAVSAIAALNCSGAVLESLPIRLVRETLFCGCPIKDTCSPPRSSPCKTLSHPCLFLSFSETDQPPIYMCDTAFESTIGVDVIISFLCPSSVHLLLAVEREVSVNKKQEAHRPVSDRDARAGYIALFVLAVQPVRSGLHSTVKHPSPGHEKSEFEEPYTGD